jgi:hypothetical protein
MMTLFLLQLVQFKQLKKKQTTLIVLFYMPNSNKKSLRAMVELLQYFKETSSNLTKDDVPSFV